MPSKTLSMEEDLNYLKLAGYNVVDMVYDVSLVGNPYHSRKAGTIVYWMAAPVIIHVILRNITQISPSFLTIYCNCFAIP